ncbi:glycosyltransferase family 2 protein [Patescibacteria group bacterium]|nr:glycosyltransferase family 2 protein [Patescibacteria group bacterium]
MSRPKLSVTVITLNEEKDLKRCLESVRDLADEIVVVDSGSMDKTVEIARKYGAKIYDREFDNYSNQKNYAIEKAKGDWILSMDADEEIPPKLAKEIKSKVKSQRSKVNAYSMPRRNIILGKFIKYSRWQPEFERHVVWLFRKGRGKWVGDVHETVELDGEVGRLENAKVHYQYETVSEFMDMMDRYSELDAGQRVKNGVKFSYFRLFFDPIYNFLVRYFYRLGFLDGWRGFILSYLMAVYHLELWVKIWGRKK